MTERDKLCNESFICFIESPNNEDGTPFRSIQVRLFYKGLNSPIFYNYLRKLMMNAMPYVVIKMDMGAIIRYVKQTCQYTEALMTHNIVNIEDASGSILALRDPATWTHPEPIKVQYVHDPSRGHPLLRGGHFCHAQTTEIMAPPEMPVLILNSPTEFTQAPYLENVSTHLIIPTASERGLRNLIPWQLARDYCHETSDHDAPGATPFVCPRGDLRGRPPYAFCFTYQGSLSLRRSLEILMEVMERDYALLLNSILWVNWKLELRHTATVLPHERAELPCFPLEFVNAQLLEQRYGQIIKGKWTLEPFDEGTDIAAGGYQFEPYGVFDQLFNSSQTFQSYLRHSPSHAPMVPPNTPDIPSYESQRRHQMERYNFMSEADIIEGGIKKMDLADDAVSEIAPEARKFCAFWEAYIWGPLKDFRDWLMDPGHYRVLSPQYQDPEH